MTPPTPPYQPVTGLEAENAALRAVAAAAREMPRATPAPGGAGTVHLFPIEAAYVWQLDRALKALGALANLRQGAPGHE